MITELGKLKAVMKKHPNLGYHGLWTDKLRRRKLFSQGRSYEQELAADRKDLLAHVDEFILCKRWLNLCDQTKRPNPRAGDSYWLKRVVEQWARRYISEAAFISAVFDLGIPYRLCPDNRLDCARIYVALTVASVDSFPEPGGPLWS